IGSLSAGVLSNPPSRADATLTSHYEMDLVGGFATDKGCEIRSCNEEPNSQLALVHNDSVVSLFAVTLDESWAFDRTPTCTSCVESQRLVQSNAQSLLRPV
ncbi:hypothetical protein N9D38_02065, partial [Rubripirellula sp.]|nr:hypothetical protein [Rubripirellula sp.]